MTPGIFPAEETTAEPKHWKLLLVEDRPDQPAHLGRAIDKLRWYGALWILCWACGWELIGNLMSPNQELRNCCTVLWILSSNFFISTFLFLKSTFFLSSHSNIPTEARFFCSRHHRFDACLLHAATLQQLFSSACEQTSSCMLPISWRPCRWVANQKMRLLNEDSIWG